MSKFALALLVIALSTHFISGDESIQCYENFHRICGSSDEITLVNQTRCLDKTFVGNDEDFCQRWLVETLTLYLEDFSSIAQYAFNTTNFATLKFISKSKNCEKKVINSTPELVHGLPSIRHLILDCADFTSTPNPFKNLISLDRLNMSRMEFTTVLEHFLPVFRKLTRLTLENVNITVITPTTFSRTNQQLEYLYLKSNSLTVIEDKSFQKLHNLRELRITQNRLTDLQADMIGGLDALEELDLEANDITVLRMNTLSELTKLRAIHLPKNKIREIEVATFFGSPSLETLDLSDNELEDLPVGFFKNFPNLTNLSFAGNKLSTVRSNVFQGLGKYTSVDLGRNNVHRIEPTAFRGLRLRNLKLNHNKLDVLESDTFNGLHVGNRSDLACNNISEIKEQAFRNLMAGLITLPSNIIGIDRDSWGVDDLVWEIERSSEC